LRAGKRKKRRPPIAQGLIGLQHNHFPASGRFRWFGPLVAAFRRAARERGGPLPSIDVADALLDGRSELAGNDGLDVYAPES